MSMTRIESNKVDVGKSSKEIFEFLSDFSNFRTLMPPQVVDWEQDAEGCSFTIKGMASLGLKYENKIPFSEIVMENKGKSPFDFKIIAKIEEAGPASKVQLFLDAELNPFLKMMAEKPLGNFLNLLVEKLKGSV